MKKKISKLFSIMLAFVMALSMAMTGFAAEEPEFSITVTHAAEGETYSAYKIFDVTSNDEDGIVTYSYTINDNSAWYQTVKDATKVFKLSKIESTTESTEPTTYVVTIDEDVENGNVVDDADIIAVFTNAVSTKYEKDANDEVKKVLYIGETQLNADATATAEKIDPNDENSEVAAVLDVFDPGYYYVATTLGSLVIIDTTDPDVEVGEKNGIPTLSKWVHENTAADDTWQHEDDANNNEDILFEIEIDNINGATNLVLHDSMDDELEIPDANNFHMKSVVLYKTDPYGDDYNGETDKVELEEKKEEGKGDYSVRVVDEQHECTVDGCFDDDKGMNCAFELDFTGYDFSDVDDTGYIELTYELHLDTEGDAYEDDVDEIENGAQVTFGIASFSSIAYAETYSYGFEVYKYTGDMVYNDSTGRYDDPSNTRPVSGVEFELKASTDEDAASAWFMEETVDLEDESTKTIFLFEGWEKPSGTESYTQTIVSGSDGMVYIEGLDTGTYYLYETKARDGYNPLNGPITVEIWATYDESSGALLTHGTTYSYGNNEGSEGTGVVNIQNNVGTILPGTGGMGTTIFYIVGIVLILGAAVVFVTKKRLEKK